MKKYFSLLIPVLLIFTILAPIGHSPTVAITPPTRIRSPTISPDVTTASTSPPNLSGISIVFLGQSHQQVSGCFNVQVNLNITDSMTTSFRLIMGNFFLYETGTNLTITNSIYYANANNTIPEVRIFPNNPIILVVTFQGFCFAPAVAGTVKVLIAYDDGTRFFKAQVFP